MRVLHTAVPSFASSLYSTIQRAMAAVVDPFSVVMHGTIGAGKTCLVHAMLGLPFSDGHASTKEEYFRSLQDVAYDNGARTKLIIHDTAGAPRGWSPNEQAWYTPLTPWFLFFACTPHITRVGGLMVYSVADEQSFQTIDALVEALPCMHASVLCAAQCDREDRVVSPEQGLALAKRLGCPFFETSARTGYNVELAFHTLMRAIADIPVTETRERRRCCLA